MKHFLFALMVALLSAATLSAQQIAVVSGSGSTRVYDTLDEAIEGASSGSTIYLPGGGFRVSEDTKITKRVAIIGIGHKPNSENEDGNTVISGNIQFGVGSDGSAIMGVYMGNDIHIGVEGVVKNITVKYCNVNSIQVTTPDCPGILVNQNYLRSNSVFNSSNVTITNNIMSPVRGIKGGIVNHNIVFGYAYFDGDYGILCEESTSMYNICTHNWGNIRGCEDVGSVKGVSPFRNNQGITTRSDFHLPDDYEGSTLIGVYGGGTGFNDGGIPPMPHIISKSVAEQTDARGKLRVQVTVKAN